MDPGAAATAEPAIISTYAIVRHADELCFHSGYSIHRLYAPEAFELDPEATVEIVGEVALETDSPRPVVAFFDHRIAEPRDVRVTDVDRSLC